MESPLPQLVETTRHALQAILDLEDDRSAIIAKHLGVTIGTVRGYFHDANEELDAQSKASALIKALNLRLLVLEVNPIPTSQLAHFPNKFLARPFTERSRHVLQTMIDLETDDLAVLGRKLHWTPSTVKTYLFKACKQLRVNSRTIAVVKALRLGLIELRDPPAESMNG
jgi:DNA-binding NarL/FixJ family response regulator